MSDVFADTNFYIAGLNQDDDLHEIAVRAGREIERRRQVTSDAVIIELLNHFSGWGPHFRRAAGQAVDNLRSNPRVDVVSITRPRLRAATDLYMRRLDKGYSLTDCIAMIICAERRITEVLTHDHHFEQEGLVVLL